MIEGGKVPSLRGGRPRHRPERVVGDKGYSYPTVRKMLNTKGIRHTIPRRSTQGCDPDFDREIYRRRNVIERLFGKLKQYRRIATRYEKRAKYYAAMLTIACIRCWL